MTAHFFLLAAAVASSGLQNPDPAGDWVLNIGARTLLTLSIRPTSDRSQPFTGSLSRPRHFQTSDAWSFSHIYGGVETAPIVGSAWRGGVLALTVQNPDDASDQDKYLLTLKDPDHAQLVYDGVPLPPMDLIRTRTMRPVATDWDKDKIYSPDDDVPSNPEMKRIFDEDQRVRQLGAKIDWASVERSDAGRRQAVLELLKKGSLHGGEDYTWAAFLFQHGSTPNDYLLAHTLALIALKKGRGDALWIASATLDRYLQSIQQPQIYGTQFLTPENKPTTQEPYDRALIFDSLRRELGVPKQIFQEEQRKQYDAERGVGK